MSNDIYNNSQNSSNPSTGQPHEAFVNGQPVNGAPVSEQQPAPYAPAQAPMQMPASAPVQTLNQAPIQTQVQAGPEYTQPFQEAGPEAFAQPFYGEAAQQVSAGTPERAPNRFGLKVVAALLVCTLLGGAIGGFLVTQYLGANRTKINPTNVVSLEKAEPSSQAVTPGTAVSNTSGIMSTPDIVAKAAPATVAIFTNTTQEVFGRAVEGRGSGSGVLISADGYIVTNNHVVGQSQDIKVTLADGSEYPAKRVGINEKNDVAVIKIEAGKTLPFLKFGKSADLRVGETIIAIGNPLGQLQGSVSQGIVSAVNRDITIENQEMKNLIQLDAAINRGNSGGALLNTRGELIGINVAKTDGNSVEGIAFAIPSDSVYTAATDIMNGKSTLRPMIGVNGVTVTEEIQQSYGLPAGVLVQTVAGDSPAEKAGLQQRDIITAINGQKTTTVAELNSEKNKYNAGDKLNLTILREGKELTVELVLGSSSTQ